MKRYIDADELEEFINLSLSDPNHEMVAFNVSYLKRCLKAMEISDVVEVVHCKDCGRHEDEEPGMVYCPDIVGGWVSNNFSCANGGNYLKL